MIGNLRRALLSFIGLPRRPDWHFDPLTIQYFRVQGYRVHHSQGRWYWYRGHGDFNGPYLSEHSAWCAAGADWEFQQAKEKS